VRIRIQGVPLSDWYASNDLLYLLVLLTAALLVPILGPHWLRGSRLSHAILFVGLLVSAAAGWLRVAGSPAGGGTPHESLVAAGVVLGLVGNLLILGGFVSYANDFRVATARASRQIREESSRADAARLQEAKLRAILDCATEYSIMSCDLEGRITSYNPGCAHVLGWQPDEVIGRMRLADLQPRARDGAFEEVARIVREQGFYEGQVAMSRKGGDEFPALLTVTALAGPDGALEGYLAIAKDIGEIRRTQDALRRERDFVRGIIETSELFIVGISLDDRRVTLFNRGAERISGHSRGDVIGRPFPDLFPDSEGNDAVWESLLRGAAGTQAGVRYSESAIRTRSGEERILSWTATLCHDDQGRATQAVAFGYDVTERTEMQRRLEQAKTDVERANSELERLATTDFLTDLANRRHVIRLLEHEIRRCRRLRTTVSVIMLDLDGFKAVNDSYGHEAGDVVLKRVAGLLAGRLRASDVASRYGGEEFLLVLPDTSLADATVVAEEVRQRIQDSPIRYEDKQIGVRASFGVAVLEPWQELAAHDLIQMADTGMYCAKRLGKNRVVAWSADLQETAEPKAAPSA